MLLGEQGGQRACGKVHYGGSHANLKKRNIVLWRRMACFAETKMALWDCVIRYHMSPMRQNNFAS